MKKLAQTTADILSAARKADGDASVAAEQQAARERLEQGGYLGPKYAGRTIGEWMDRADAGMANIHEIRQALYRATPKAKDTVPALARWLSHRHRHFRHAAARTLGLIGPDAHPAADALVQLIDDRDGIVRAQALESLASIGVPQVAIPKIALRIEDSDKVVQRSALDCLAQIGRGAVVAVPQLVAALSNDQVVAQAANALGAIGPLASGAVPALARVLSSHEFFEYRCAAATALGRIGTSEALDALTTGLTDRHKDVRHAARSAIKSNGT